MGRTMLYLGLATILAVVLVGFAVWTQRHNAKREDIRAGRPARGDLSRGKEQRLRDMLDDAAALLQGLGAGDPLFQEVDVLTAGTAQARDAWLARYDRVRARLG